MMQRSALAAAGHTFRTENISERVQGIVISPIKEMGILADTFQETTKTKIISFGQGIPYVDTPTYIKQGIKQALLEPDTAKYTLEPGITELRERIAIFLERDKKIRNIKAKKEIMVTAGCQEALACALATIIDPGDEVLLLEPAFASHIEQILQFGGTPIFVPLDEQQGWKLDIRECEKRITKKTKALVFCNPMNPTGAVLGQHEIHELARLAKTHNLILLTDETYDFLTYDGVKHFSPASIPAIRDRVILCSSFSKKYALTGYRVGYAFAHAGIIDHMLKVHDALTICAPAVSQKAAITALKGPQRSLRAYVKKLAFNRDLMCRELNTIKDIFEYQIPKGAYYILAKVKRPFVNSFALALKILHEAHIIVVPGAAFGPSGEGHLRFSFAGSPENIVKGFNRLRKWAEQWKKEGYPL